MKKLLTVLLSLTMCCGLCKNSLAAESNEIKVVLNGQQLNFDVEPQIINDCTMVPMRVIFESLGYTVEWNDANKSIYALNPITGNVMLMLMDYTVMYTFNYADYISASNQDEFIYNYSKTLEVAPQIINDRTLVPVRAISETSGANVTWDGNTRTVYLNVTIDNKVSSDETLYYEEASSLYSFANVLGYKEIRHTADTANRLYAYTYLIPESLNMGSLYEQYHQALIKSGYTVYQSQNNATIYINYSTNMLVSVAADTSSRTIIIVFGEADTGTTNNSNSTYYEDSSSEKNDEYIQKEISKVKKDIKTIKAEIKDIEVRIKNKEDELNNVAYNRDSQVIMGNRVVNVGDPYKINKIKDEIEELEIELEYYEELLAEYEDYLDELKKL